LQGNGIFDKNRWEPTDEIITAIAEAIFSKLIYGTALRT
jgi:hypothetical protein